MSRLEETFWLICQHNIVTPCAYGYLWTRKALESLKWHYCVRFRHLWTKSKLYPWVVCTWYANLANLLLILHKLFVICLTLMLKAHHMLCDDPHTNIHTRARWTFWQLLPWLRPRRSGHHWLSSRRCQAAARPRPRRRSWRRCPLRLSRSSAGWCAAGLEGHPGQWGNRGTTTKEIN